MRSDRQNKTTVLAFPIRVRDRLRRELFKMLLRPRDRGLVRLGSDYGGWWIPPEALVRGAVAYCAGAGEDVTFDLALAELDLQVTTFDPTPRAIAHVDALGAVKNHRFVPVGWWDCTDVIRFYAPRNPEHVSHSALNVRGTDSYFTAEVKAVSELMRELGDVRVDIIKMDIEGAETRVIPSVLNEGPLAPVVCIEFDQPQTFRTMLALVNGLRRAGYSVAKVERWNVTFVQDHGSA